MNESEIKTQLDEVNAAISAIVGGAQEYSVGNRNVKKANLSELIKLRNSLEFRLSRITGNGYTLGGLSGR